MRSIQKTEYITNVAEIAYLNDQPENDVDDPVYLKMKIDLGSMHLETSGWRQLLLAIEAGGKFVDLDLSACTAAIVNMYRPDYEEQSLSRYDILMVYFNPDRNIASGKDKIVSLALPDTARWTPSANNATETPPFEYFTVLRSFSGKGLTEFGNYTFLNRTSLVHVSLPPGFEYLNDRTFQNCTGITEITIPASIIKVCTYAFVGATNLVLVTFLGETPPRLAFYPFGNPASTSATLPPPNPNLRIEVPKGSVDAYKAVWSLYADRIFESP
jgi:hypothetical protein